MTAPIILGGNIERATAALVGHLSALPLDVVVELSVEVRSSIEDLLPPGQSVFGLRLLTQGLPGMAGRGWLVGRYYDACRDRKISPTQTVSIYEDGFFRAFDQHGELPQETLFVAFGFLGRDLLVVLKQAQSSFDRDNFDEDGYAV